MQGVCTRPQFTGYAPATKSARQETSENSNHNGGTDQRPLPTTANHATARASNGAWRFTQCCTCHEFCTWRFTKCCACHEICSWRFCACHEICTWSFTKCCACHEICTWRFTKCCACHQNLHVKKQVKTLIAMEERTDDRRRPRPTTQQPEPLTEHGGSQSAVPATNSGDVSVCVVTKCCACHEICTWRFTKCCACHEICTSRNK